MFVLLFCNSAYDLEPSPLSGDKGSKGIETLESNCFLDRLWTNASVCSPTLQKDLVSPTSTLPGFCDTNFCHFLPSRWMLASLFTFPGPWRCCNVSSCFWGIKFLWYQICCYSFPIFFILGGLILFSPLLLFSILRDKYMFSLTWWMNDTCF